MTALRDFLVALTFLTRLGRAHITASEAIARSMYMYPLVGVLMGALAALGSLLPLSSWVLAWALAGLNLYLTRGLHWDGWADLWDGWGSGATGERFWEIVKDSRVGAFGTMGLILGLGLQAALLERAVALHAWPALVFAPAFGRFCCLLLARLGRSLSRPGLGQNALNGATLRALIVGGTMTLAAALLPGPGHFALTLALTALPLGVLLALARRQNGLNGDFLGAAIVAGELCALLPLSLQF